MSLNPVLCRALHDRTKSGSLLNLPSKAAFATVFLHSSTHPFIHEYFLNSYSARLYLTHPSMMPTFSFGSKLPYLWSPEQETTLGALGSGKPMKQ